MAWLNGFYNRFKMTIASSDVDSTLTDFPVMITLTSGSGKTNFDVTGVFDELSYDDRKKIAVTLDDGTTQCPVEIEYWNNTEERAFLWTKVPSVYSSVNTDLYFYYDATYSGTTSSGNVGYVAEINDTDYQMVVNYNIEGTYDTNNVARPSVIKESDTSYKMWYAGYDGIGWHILYAVSVDGISWTGHQIAVAKGSEGTYDTHRAINPCVIKESDTSYKMWYAGFNNVNYRIIYATSTDGINWSNFQMVININQEGTYDILHAQCPCVVKESDTSYKIWYGASSAGNYRIIYATSVNGINWSNYQMVLNYNLEGTYDTTHAIFPYVINQDDGSYVMWYSGYSAANGYRILKTTSPNGTTWATPELDLDTNNEGTYDTNWVYMPWVLDDGGNNIMWYVGHDGSNSRIMRSTYWNNPVWDVWDSDFKAVYHMHQDPTTDILDSTRNANHGSSTGSMNSNDLIDGKIGKAIDFDGNNDGVDVAHDTTLAVTSNFNFEVFFRANPDSNHRTLFGKWNSSNGMGWSIRTRNNDCVEIGFKYNGSNYWNSYWNSTLSGSEYYYTSCYFPGAGASPILYVNGDAKSLININNVGNVFTTGVGDSGQAMTIGYGRHMGTTIFYHNDYIDEARLSTTERNAVWSEVTYKSSEDNLITYSNIESTTPIFTFNGYVQVEGSPAERTVHLFRRSTGELMDTATSNSSTGYFELSSYYNDYHFIVILPLLSETYDLIAHDRIDPGV